MILQFKMLLTLYKTWPFFSNMSLTLKTSINPLRQKENSHLFADDVFICIILNENSWISNNISLKYVPYGLIDNVIIGSDNGLASNRRQAIIWTNNGLVYWRIYASLGLNELVYCSNNGVVLIKVARKVSIKQSSSWLHATAIFTDWMKQLNIYAICSVIHLITIITVMLSWHATDSTFLWWQFMESYYACNTREENRCLCKQQCQT